MPYFCGIGLSLSQLRLQSGLLLVRELANLDIEFFQCCMHVAGACVLVQKPFGLKIWREYFSEINQV